MRPITASEFTELFNPTPFPSKLRVPFPQVGYLNNVVNSTSQLKSDVKLLVINHLFCDVNLTSHQSMVTQPRTFQDFFRIRQKQPSVSATAKSDNPDESKKTTNPTKVSTKQLGPKEQIASLILAKVLPKQANVTESSFDQVFPNTTLGYVHLVNGTAKLSRSLFNALLLSKLRAAKTYLKLDHREKLHKDVVLHISRLISKMALLKLNSLKSNAREQKLKKEIAIPKTTQPSEDSKPATSTKKKSKKATKKTKLDIEPKSIEFVSGAKPEVPLPSTEEDASKTSSHEETIHATPNSWKHESLPEKQKRYQASRALLKAFPTLYIPALEVNSHLYAVVIEALKTESIRILFFPEIQLIPQDQIKPRQPIHRTPSLESYAERPFPCYLSPMINAYAESFVEIPPQDLNPLYTWSPPPRPATPPPKIVNKETVVKLKPRYTVYHGNSKDTFRSSKSLAQYLKDFYGKETFDRIKITYDED